MENIATQFEAQSNKNAYTIIKNIRKDKIVNFTEYFFII
tara:strand:- start:62 stop:178 length:117 start_codon:yes stop_codon:yes gene_type:complete